MNHGNKKGRRFGRVKKQRDAMISSMAVSLLENERIVTTEAKAKELARVIEPLITKARKNSVHARRLLSKNLPSKTVKKLVDDIAPRYEKRPGGYTRITHIKRRQTDGAKMAKIQLL